MKKTISLLTVTIFCVLMMGCGVKQEIHDAKVKEAEQLKKELDDLTRAKNALQEEFDVLRSENRTLAGRLQELGDNVENLLGEKSRLAGDLKATKEREAKLRREREAQKARMAKYRQVIQKFRDLVTSGKLKIRIVRGQMVVELSSNILFSSGKAELSEEGETALAELAQILMTIADRNFQIAGHTDNVPIKSKRFKSNWELSSKRAVTVVKFLQEAGVNPASLSAAGFAEYKPAVSNDTAEGKAANRRIEIVLLPNLDELPDLSDLEKDLSGK